MNVTNTMPQISALQALSIASPHATLACLEMARQLATPQAIIHIGAGLGHGPFSHWLNWPVAYARVIDSDAKRLEWLSARAAQQTSSTDWLALGGVLAEQDGERELHHASNPAEDGLLPASALVGLWPNLRPLSTSHQQAQRLDTLLSSYPIPVQEGEGTTWLMVECLPALSILRGATQTLENVSVICLRSVLDPARLEVPEASLEAAVDFLNAWGFRCAHIGETNHPAIGEALFLRDETAPLKAECTTLQMAKTTAEQLANEYQGQIDTLTKDKADLTTERDALAQERAELTQVRDEKAKQAESTNQERDTLKQQLEQRTQERDQALLQAKEQANQHKQSLDDKAQQLTGRDKQLAERTQQRDEKAKQVENATKGRDTLKQQLEQSTQELYQAQQQANQHKQVLDEKAQQLTERDNQLAERTQQRDEATQRTETAEAGRDIQLKTLDEAQSKIEQLAADNESMTQSNEQLESEYKEQLRSAQLSTKLLAKVEADASELRERYAKLSKNEQELRDLIRELDSKLEAASRFYHQLSQKHPELLEEL
ncbi:hypothetical protein [Stutzerimonas stutzeri]|uniref:hypothetical protein n=1 Tax=Stutzerimonas stutzeri TaxID=316 RepID=UPI00210AA19C|nr:hypothetical protein [Stutzerimonas stutzeri]MCQ4321758.1 hypothetical protein [Stutzerimonas stutzeri]